MSHRGFEDAICELFRKLGYEAERTPYSKDGGKDGILTKNGATYVLECKRYKQSGLTSRPQLQILIAAMHDEQAQGAIFVTTGSFTSDAIKYAHKNKISLYDRKSLPTLVNEAHQLERELIARTMCLECGDVVDLAVKAAAYDSTCPMGHAIRTYLTTASLAQAGIGVPTCKSCNLPMQMVKTGKSAFWGCIKLPYLSLHKESRSK